MSGYYLYKDRNGEDHCAYVSEFDWKIIEAELKQCLEELIPAFHVILYEAIEAVNKDDWSEFLEKVDSTVRLTDRKRIYEAHFDAKKLKDLIEANGNPKKFDYLEAIQKLIEEVTKNPVIYPVIQQLSESEFVDYSMKELEALEKSDEINQASMEFIREGWDYLPTYSEYDENTTFRQDDFKNRQYLGLVDCHGRILGMTRFSIDTITQQTEFKPFDDTYFVNKDGEMVLINPSRKLGKRLVELTKNYLHSYENVIKEKFEHHVQSLKDALPINFLPNARALYTWFDEDGEALHSICCNASDVEGLDKATAIKELAKALIIKNIADELHDNELFEQHEDPRKYRYRKNSLETFVEFTDGQTFLTANNCQINSKDTFDSLLKTIRTVTKIQSINEIAPIERVLPLEGSICFNRDFRLYESWCNEHEDKYCKLSH